MDQAAVQRAAEILNDARARRRRIDGLPDDCRPRTIEDGYRVQDALTALRAIEVAAWKIGSTSKQAQAIVGTTEPFGAPLAAAICHASPAAIPREALFMRALEVEFAFTMAADLPPDGAPYSRERVIAAVATLHPAIEVSDSRYTDWSVVGAPSIIADGGNDGAFVLGEGIAAWRGFDLPAHAAALWVNGAKAADGIGARVLGDPVTALVWLANDRARRGDGLRAGQVVSTGSCTGVTMAEPGDSARAEMGGMGTVELTFGA